MSLKKKIETKVQKRTATAMKSLSPTQSKVRQKQRRKRFLWRIFLTKSQAKHTRLVINTKKKSSQMRATYPKRKSMRATIIKKKSLT